MRTVSLPTYRRSPAGAGLLASEAPVEPRCLDP